jgi:RNA polymerase sigma-70 factor (ECF subfamily)
MLTIAEAYQRTKAAERGGQIASPAVRRSPTNALGASPSDDALIEAIAAGDRHAMALLYARHSARVYRFSMRITGDLAAAEDIVSEVFLEVWRRAGGFKAKAQVSTWLLAIARNKSVSALRRRVDEPLEDEAAAVEDPADNAEALVHSKDRSDIVQKCLEQLSTAHREVIDLVYYHEKTVEEVAEIVRAPASTVKTRMFYARQRLQVLLNAAGFNAY